MKKTQSTVPVSTRALLQRINRRLKPDFECVRTTKGERARLDLGYYYQLDYRRNLVLHTNIDLEEFGRELGALQPWEYWASEDSE